MMPNPEVCRTSIDFYVALMYGPSPLSRAQREMLATVVSRINHCHY
jgi:alkylhydroperoxidase family enzyme